MKHPIEMLYRNPPIRIVGQLIQMDSNGFACWRAGSFAEAQKIFRNELSFIEDIENEENRGIHKGGTLFDIGRTMVFQGKAKEAIYYFLSSYVEDALSVGLGEESDAANGLVFTFLRNYYGIGLEIFSEINKAVMTVKESGRWRDSKDPNKILEMAAVSLNLEMSDMSLWVKSVPIGLEKRMPFGFPQPWDRRVFVEGNYDDKGSLAVLYKIDEVIRKVDPRYFPVMAFEISIDKDFLHHLFMVLHTCKYAIFEVTTIGTQTVEIERACSYDIEILILHNKKKNIKNEIFSDLLKTIQKRNVGCEAYSKIEDIPKIIDGFIPRIG